MSSMRNAIQRRNHRERGQEEGRQKWGLLEKHKDYSLRAKDHNIKKTKLKQLRQKALERNPDEFYYAMLSQKGPSAAKKKTGTKDGDRGNSVLSQDTVRLLKTQDLGYIRTMRNKATKEVESLRTQAIGIKSKGKKIVYADSREEQVEKFKADDSFGGWEDEDDDEGIFEMEGVEGNKETDKLRELRQKEAEKIERKLRAAEDKLKALTDAEEALDLQRAKMAKSPTVGGITKAGKKFKIRERKR